MPLFSKPISKVEEFFQETFIQEKPDDSTNCCALDDNSSIAVNFMEKDDAMTYMRTLSRKHILTLSLPISPPSDVHPLHKQWLAWWYRCPS